MKEIEYLATRTMIRELERQLEHVSSFKRSRETEMATIKMQEAIMWLEKSYQRLDKIINKRLGIEERITKK